MDGMSNRRYVHHLFRRPVLRIREAEEGSGHDGQAAGNGSGPKDHLHRVHRGEDLCRKSRLAGVRAAVGRRSGRCMKAEAGGERVGESGRAKSGDAGGRWRL